MKIESAESGNLQEGGREGGGEGINRPFRGGRIIVKDPSRFAKVAKKFPPIIGGKRGGGGKNGLEDAEIEHSFPFSLFRRIDVLSLRWRHLPKRVPECQKIHLSF